MLQITFQFERNSRKFHSHQVFSVLPVNNEQVQIGSLFIFYQLPSIWCVIVQKLPNHWQTICLINENTYPCVVDIYLENWRWKYEKKYPRMKHQFLIMEADINWLTWHIQFHNNDAPFEFFFFFHFLASNINCSTEKSESILEPSTWADNHEFLTKRKCCFIS